MEENWAEIRMKDNILILHSNIESKELDITGIENIEEFLGYITEIDWIKSGDIYVPKPMEANLIFPIHLRIINPPNKFHISYLNYGGFFIYPKNSGLETNYKNPINSYFSIGALQYPGYECISQELSSSDLKILIYKIKQGDYILRKEK